MQGDVGISNLEAKASGCGANIGQYSDDKGGDPNNEAPYTEFRPLLSYATNPMPK